MLDGRARRMIDPGLDRIAAILARAGVAANAVTYAGFALGVGAAAAIVGGHLRIALVLILISRLADGLDGAVAKIQGKTDFGGLIDIVLDFAFYGLIPLAFVIADPASNAIAGAVLITAFYINGGSFLAYAVMAEKRGLSTDVRGSKSLFFTTGLAEAAETLGAFILFCLLPAWFWLIAYAFAAMTVYTTISRLVLAGRELR